MQMEQIYRAAIDKWGKDAQYDQAVEECAELITALKHYRRGKVDKQAVIAELADVSLMLGQLSWMFGAEQVETAVKTKLEKLDTLLKTP
ncbi:MAG: antitoxin [Deltaproteobacteria bacterium]|nr:antitoxin [Deltaproteobacteria bacterium]